MWHGKLQWITLYCIIKIQLYSISVLKNIFYFTLKKGHFGYFTEYKTSSRIKWLSGGNIFFFIFAEWKRSPTFWKRKDFFSNKGWSLPKPNLISICMLLLLSFWNSSFVPFQLSVDQCSGHVIYLSVLTKGVKRHWSSENWVKNLTAVRKTVVEKTSD